ncbi:hypothetical protein BJX99DRAFT_256507 [Aspergillus californicus]
MHLHFNITYQIANFLETNPNSLNISINILTTLFLLTLTTAIPPNPSGITNTNSNINLKLTLTIPTPHPTINHSKASHIQASLATSIPTDAQAFYHTAKATCPLSHPSKQCCKPMAIQGRQCGQTILCCSNAGVGQGSSSKPGSQAVFKSNCIPYDQAMEDQEAAIEKSPSQVNVVATMGMGMATSTSTGSSGGTA